MKSFITPELLAAVGVNPSDELLIHLNETFEERIGAEVTESLDDTQLAVLLDLQENGDEQALSEWLLANIPELGDIIQDEADILLGEITENAEGLNQS